MASRTRREMLRSFNCVVAIALSVSENHPLRWLQSSKPEEELKARQELNMTCNLVRLSVLRICFNWRKSIFFSSTIAHVAWSICCLRRHRGAVGSNLWSACVVWQASKSADECGSWDHGGLQIWSCRNIWASGSCSRFWSLNLEHDKDRLRGPLGASLICISNFIWHITT